MILRGIDFGVVLAASGAMGNFGIEPEYKHHKVLEVIKLLNKNGTTFVSKTATSEYNSGNMPFKNDKYYTPKKWFPDCIKVDPMSGNILNSVGLSNPGFKEFLDTGIWQNIKQPYFISIMANAHDAPDNPGGAVDTRKAQMQNMIDVLVANQKTENKLTNFGLQINLSCPNIGNDTCAMAKEADDIISIASTANVPLMAKFSVASTSIEALLELQKNPNLDSICISNTLPYGWQPESKFYTFDKNSYIKKYFNPKYVEIIEDGEYYYVERIKWENIFGAKSPLEPKGYGAGGLSGPILKPFVLHFIEQLREAGFTLPINGGGGISSADDVDLFKRAGANSVFYGSVSNTRPLAVQKIIKRAKQVFANGYS